MKNKRREFSIAICQDNITLIWSNQPLGVRLRIALAALFFRGVRFIGKIKIK